MKKFFKYLIILFLIATQAAYACSRVLWNNNDQAVMVGRTFDWGSDPKTNLWLMPEGVVHHNSNLKNPLNWTAKYGSLIATVNDQIAFDGLNEKGFAVQVLWLDETNYGKRDLTKPGLPVIWWMQFYLDNFATVNEAVKYTEQHPFQILPVFYKPTGEWLNLHLALDDASGDSAIIEFIKGRIHIYHGPQFKVLTNSPALPKQLANLRKYQNFGGKLALPGSDESGDRFVRASYYLNQLPEPKTKAEAVAMLQSLLANVFEQFKTPTSFSEGIYPTYWLSISDLTNRVYYFEYLKNSALIWVDLKLANLKKDAPVMRLNLEQINLSGDVTKDFIPVV